LPKQQKAVVEREMRSFHGEVAAASPSFFTVHDTETDCCVVSAAGAVNAVRTRSAAVTVMGISRRLLDSSVSFTKLPSSTTRTRLYRPSATSSGTFSDSFGE
jgi:hypothetical protein